MLTIGIAHTATNTVAVGSTFMNPHEMQLTSGEAGMHTKYSRNAPENSGQRRTAPKT